MIRAGHVACVGDRRNVRRGLVGKPEGKRPLGRLRLKREGIILKSIFMKWEGEALTGLLWLRIGTGGGRL